jgi:hypothetical protein
MQWHGIGNTDLTSFVVNWLADLDQVDAPARGLLEHVGEGYDYGAHFLMANIAPEAMLPSATDSVLLLYAILAVFQADEFPGCNDWQGATEHVDRAFDYGNALGATAVATKLLGALVDRSTRHPSRNTKRSMGGEPARLAAYDRDLASIQVRDFGLHTCWTQPS